MGQQMLHCGDGDTVGAVLGGCPLVECSWRFAISPTIEAYRDFPGGTMVKNPTASARDARDDGTIEGKRRWR